MNKPPKIRCDAWKDGELIPTSYTANKEPNIQPPGSPQPENRVPGFTFSNLPADTKSIALVVHDVLDGDPVDGVRPGWTHYTALYSRDGELQQEGLTSEEDNGWVGPYPDVAGEYHATAYFLNTQLSSDKLSRRDILDAFKHCGVGTANMIGRYVNPNSQKR